MKYQLITREWFDKVNGNSYFASRIYRNDELLAVLPFQYGYGTHHEWEAMRELQKQGKQKNAKNPSAVFNLIEKIENCSQRSVKNWGQA